jgi:hypothetical protein
LVTNHDLPDDSILSRLSHVVAAATKSIWISRTT